MALYQRKLDNDLRQGTRVPLNHQQEYSSSSPRGGGRYVQQNRQLQQHHTIDCTENEMAPQPYNAPPSPTPRTPLPHYMRQPTPVEVTSSHRRAAHGPSPSSSSCGPHGKDLSTSMATCGPRLDVPSRIDTGRGRSRTEVSRGISKAREAILKEEEEKKRQKRALSPAFRGQSPRFGSRTRPDVQASQYDQNCYVRTLSSANHDFYRPPGMGEQAAQKSSRGSSPMRSRTPRFGGLVAHGGGLVSPVVNAKPRASPQRTMYD